LIERICIISLLVFTLQNYYYKRFIKFKTLHIMRKILYLALMLIIGALTAEAYDYPYLNFLASDGTLQTMTVDGMTIAFNDGNMVVTNGDGNQTFVLSEMDKMYFTESSGLNQLVAEADESVEVFNVSGICLGRFANAKQALAALDRGTYVMKSKSATIKIAVK